MASRRTPADDATGPSEGPREVVGKAKMTELAPGLLARKRRPVWFEFVGPYPVTVMSRGLPVSPGDRVEWPDGPPDDTNWRPCPAPTPESPRPAGGGSLASAPEES